MNKATVICLFVGASLAACSSASNTPTRFAISASTNHVTFGIAQYLPTPAAVTLTKPDGFSNVSVSVGDPTQTGASFSAINGATSGTLTIFPVSLGAKGTTDVVVTDGDGSSADVSVTQQLCGRPEAIASPPPALVAPANSATGVSPTIGSITISDYDNHVFALHFILGSSATYDSPTPLTFYSPGAIGVTGPGATAPYSMLTTKIPNLPPATTVRVQYYDDTCEPPWILGSFTTQ